MIYTALLPACLPPQLTSTHSALLSASDVDTHEVGKALFSISKRINYDYAMHGTNAFAASLKPRCDPCPVTHFPSSFYHPSF